MKTNVLFNGGKGLKIGRLEQIDLKYNTMYHNSFFFFFFWGEGGDLSVLGHKKSSWRNKGKRLDKSHILSWFGFYNPNEEKWKRKGHFDI